MMSQYMTKVLWKTPVDAEKADYADVDESLGDLADFIQTAYAYKIMWINADGTPIKKFNPRGKVTRAEYATVFSRVLFGDKYNKSEWNYYEDHLNALKDAEILTNTTPTIQEVRGWVMLMMYRSKDVKIETSTEESTWTTIWMPNPAAVYCEEQGGTVSIVKDAEWNESGMCKLADGTEVDEWEYYRANHQDETATTWDVATWDVAPLYTQEDLEAAEKTITEEGFWKMTVKVENVKLTYMWDEKAKSELEYCKEFEEREWLTIDECIVFESEFYIPEQDAEMAWAFEPNKTLTGYQWYLGRTKGWEWKILTMGY
jgi:putative hemolysin